MIVPLNGKINSVSGFSSNEEVKPKLKYDKDTLLKNNFATRSSIAYDKLTNAATLYTAKGLKGNKNANFYEFLTIGTIPYIIGSLTLMSVFNTANKHFSNFAKSKASIIGGKMALGVLFYGLAKELSKPLITRPVKFATGVDVDLPYAKVVNELPDYKDDTDVTSIEHHKVFESVEFPRWDLLYGDESKGEKRNAYYDHIAKKMGLGENLKDSDQEVKPRIKEIVTRTHTIINTVPYLWAGIGVGVAFQKPWESFLSNTSLKFYKLREYKNDSKNPAEKTAKIDITKTAKNIGNETLNRLKALKNAFKNSIKDFYTGGENATKFQKWGGKSLFWLATIATIVGVGRILTSSIEPSKTDSSDVIEKNRKYIVN